jgi:hypothetical protein
MPGGNEWEETMSTTGECLCGGVRFQVASVLAIGMCHCSRCRKAYGAPFAIEAVVPTKDFRLISGADLITFDPSGDAHRAFCKTCGSRAPFQAMDGEVTLVPAGLFDDDPKVKPTFHMFVGSKAPWWDITDDLPQHEEWLPGFGPAGEK